MNFYFESRSALTAPRFCRRNDYAKGFNKKLNSVNQCIEWISRFKSLNLLQRWFSDSRVIHLSHDSRVYSSVDLTPLDLNRILNESPMNRLLRPFLTSYSHSTDFISPWSVPCLYLREFYLFAVSFCPRSSWHVPSSASFSGNVNYLPNRKF